MSAGAIDARPEDVAGAISRSLRSTGHRAAVAESLTAGAIASSLGAAEAAAEWFCGGVVAYRNEVKFTVLGVDPGPVITAACARQLARGVAVLTGAGFGLGVTGVGGPGPTEQQPAGTVFIAVHDGRGETVTEYHFDGPPGEVVEQARLAALLQLRAAVEYAGTAVSGTAAGPGAGSGRSGRR
jgi:nicotinamide-nucleotide amidase